MKNIAIPLLLANSAKADNAAKKKAMMMMDKMVPEPILIAAEYWELGCEAQAVTDAADDLAEAQVSLQEAADARVALDTAVGDAIDAKNVAVQAVIDKEAGMAAALALDDAAQQDVITKKRALDAANAAKTAAIAEQSAKETAFNDATTAKGDAEDLLLLMETAASEALDHYGKEQQQTSDLGDDKDDAETAITTAVTGFTAQEATALSNYNTSKDDYYGIASQVGPPVVAAVTGTIQTTNWRKAEMDVAEANKDKIAPYIVTADNAVLNTYVDSTDPAAPVDSIAKQVKDAIAVRDTQVAAVGPPVVADAFLTLMNTQAQAWGLLSKAATRTMKDWNLEIAKDETNAAQWTAVHATTGCGTESAAQNTKDYATTEATNAANDPDIYDEATCMATCTALTAWTMRADNANQPGNVETDGWTALTSVTTTCYGYAYKASTGSAAGADFVAGECKLMASKIPTAAGSATTTSCNSRNKSTVGKSSGAIINAAASTETAWTDFDGSVTNWNNQGAAVDALQRTLDAAQRYRDQLYAIQNTNTPALHLKYDAAAANGGYIGVYNTANNDHVAAKALSDADWDECCSATLATSKLYLWNAATKALTDGQALFDSLVLQVAAQDDEEAAQLVVKGLADQDVIDQGNLIDTLTDDLSDASDAKDVADGDLVTATNDQGTASDDFDTAEEDAGTSAAGMTADVADLLAKRGTVGDAIDDLNAALGDLTDQETLIADAQSVVDGKTQDHLDAVVACKEANYDEYAATLADAIATRIDNLDTIEGLIDDALAAIPAAGTVGARCEKALSNGTFRPRRDAETVCGSAENCCGAARIPVQNADGTDSDTMMTIETCQTVATATYSWRPPRGPMETTLPAAASYPFTCIEGAQKLAAAASALATAVYMLA